MNINKPSMMILGSTGSVGEQAIDVAEKFGVTVDAISAHKNVKRAEEQARHFGVKACAMSDPDAAKDLKERLKDTDIKVYAKTEGICEMIAETNGNGESGQVVENSIVGEAGLKPTLTTLNCKKKLALANKESLVVSGEAVMKAAKEKGIEILPVDSEHCAIFQCLRSGKNEEIKNLILTASGGPFFSYNKEQLSGVTVETALAHPTWKMGPKITIDSATLMNKGFEVIEAVHLFGVKPEQVRVVVHRESIIHSAVEYIDNSVIAQMSVPDMRHCVQYALTHPERIEATTKELDLFSIGKLTFAKPDMGTFVLLAKAYEAIILGGAVPAVLNAANEEAVAAFLNKKIGFCDIFDVVCNTVDAMSYCKDIHDPDEILEAAASARERATALISKRN
ncbi:MAG: 1-deoxy-D-xylulose-5-phosphate reductoisomerase [Ruminococcaceae bacterium]|nr:1-deoxy-D-xylulose-5-phosphate reductoisomerase [Oscillospiraceae bacterium]